MKMARRVLKGFSPVGAAPLYAALLALLLAAACSNPVTSIPGHSGGTGALPSGKGRISLRIDAPSPAAAVNSGGARTALPGAFTRYELQFSYNGAGNYTHAQVNITGTGTSVDLEPGSWTITALAYTETTLSGTGSTTVTVTAGVSGSATITIGMSTGSPGTFSYTISYPAVTYTAKTLTITALDGVQVGSIHTLSANGVKEGTVSLNPGNYFAHFVLENTGERTRASWTTAVQIWPGQESTAAHVFALTDFVALVPITGTANLTINLPLGMTVAAGSKKVLAYSDSACTAFVSGAEGSVDDGGAYLLFVPASLTGVWLQSEFRTGLLTVKGAPVEVNIGANLNAGITGQNLTDTFYSITIPVLTGGTVTSPPTVRAGESVSLNISPSPLMVDNPAAGYMLTGGTLVYNDGVNPPVPITGTNFIMPAANISLVASFHTLTQAAVEMQSINAVTITVSSCPSGAENGSPFYNAGTTPVPVNPFEIGRTEVTYQLWYDVYQWAVHPGRESGQYTFTAGSGSEGSSSNTGLPTGRTFEPAANLSWRDAVVWCNAYSEMRGKTPVYRNSADAVIRNASGSIEDDIVQKAGTDGYRLPTEQEWEFAARGGNPADTAWAYAYAGSETIDDVAWYEGNAASKTHAVAQLDSNTLGIFDMSGNVSEWCWDLSASYRVIRGGGYNSTAAGYARLAARSGGTPEQKGYNTGFRVARNPDDVYSISISGISNGTVATSPSGISQAKAGTLVTITAAPDEGYLFNDQCINAGALTLTPVPSSNPPQYTFTMPSGDVTVTDAFYADDPYIQVAFTAPGDEIIDLTQNVQYNLSRSNSYASIQITAPSGYTSYAWFLDGVNQNDSDRVFTVSFYASPLTVGNHRVSAVVFKGTVPYSKELVFRVIP